MAKTGIEYHEELSEIFDKLEGFEEIENRLGYYNTEKQITDDLVKIKESVLDIYGKDKKIDRTLIKPLKIKLIRLGVLLDYFEKSEKNKEFVKNDSIKEIRTLVSEISNLKTNNSSKLKDSFSKDGFNQVGIETMNFINSQYNSTTKALSNLWNNSTDDYLEEVEIEKKDFINKFCKECEIYIARNRYIIDNLDTKQDRFEFAIDILVYAFEVGIGPSKFKLVFGKKFNILDDIEEYGGELYSLIADNKSEIKEYMNAYI